jgi:hypothetical protein
MAHVNAGVVADTHVLLWPSFPGPLFKGPSKTNGEFATCLRAKFRNQAGNSQGLNLR